MTGSEILPEESTVTEAVYLKSGLEAAESLGDRTVRVAKELLELGVARSHIRRIIANYELDQIERQIRWLPYRRAKSPAAILVAAIDGDYEEPAVLQE